MSEPIITPGLFKFLRELKKNNNRQWFAENKLRYERDVRERAVELVRQLERPLAKAAPMLMAIPKGHGGSVMRIYQDTRFSKDKTPYKTNVGISLRHEACKDIHAPGVYIHLDPDECFIAAGCWRPEKNVLAATRAAIDQNPKAWLRARDNKTFRKSFELAGESLKSKPRDYPANHPLIDDLKRIDLIAVAPLSQKELTHPAVVAVLMDRIKQSKPLMQFLCNAIELPY